MAVALFVVSGLCSLGASFVLVTRLERLGARLAAPQAMLGLAVALAADSPEISTAVVALQSGQHDIGVGVVLGSNVFNLAALIGVSAIVAGRIAVHRRVVVFEGFVAVGVAILALAAIAGVITPPLALVLAVALLIPYVAISALPSERRGQLPLPESWRRWLADAVAEEEAELADAVRAGKGGALDVPVAILALAVVVAASVVLERTASTLGVHWGISSIVVGGIVLAVVTSLPNAVAAVYLASRGRGPATLAEALNSNALNVVAGLLIPTVIVAGAPSLTHADALAALWYAGLTVVVLILAFRGRGVGRREGSLIVALYAAFAVVLATA